MPSFQKDQIPGAVLRPRMLVARYAVCIAFILSSTAHLLPAQTSQPENRAIVKAAGDVAVKDKKVEDARDAREHAEENAKNATGTGQTAAEKDLVEKIESEATAKEEDRQAQRTLRDLRRDQEKVDAAARREHAREAAEYAAASSLVGYGVCSLPQFAQDAYVEAYRQGTLQESGVAVLMKLKSSQDPAKFEKDQQKIRETYSKNVKKVLGDGSNPTLAGTLRRIGDATVSAEDKKLHGDQVFTKEEGEALTREITDVVADLEKNKPPRNILCSESLLDWSEASDALGRRVANQYIVLQVTVRNLDPNHEFLLHDVQVMLNTERFHATHDRKVVRGVGEIGQMFGPRAVLINSATALGNAVGSAQGALSAQGNLGLNIWQSGIVPGLKLILPDYTIRQLSRIDDLGFSSGASTMVIPKNSSVAVLVFVPQKGFLWHCEVDPSVKNPSMCDEEQIPVVFRFQHLFSFHHHYGFAQKRLRDLTSAEMNWLQDRIEILVAGAHVEQVQEKTAQVTNDKDASIAEFTCAAADFNRFFDNPGNPVLCSVTGTQLDRIAHFHLQLAGESTARADAILQDVADDKKSAKASFEACNLTNLSPGQYMVIADGGT